MATGRPTRRRLAWSAQLVVVAAIGALVVPVGTTQGDVVSVRVNNPAGDAAVEDGTHLTQGIPAFAAVDVQNPRTPQIVATFSDSAGFRKDASGLGVSVSLDGGKTWTDLGQNAEPGVSVIGTPTVAFDRKRNQVATIYTSCDEETDECALRYRAIAGTEMSSPHAVGAAALASYLNHDVAVDNTPTSPGYGTIYATWSESRFGLAPEVRLARSTDGGVTWSNAARVSAPSEPASGPQVAVATGGTVFVSYAEVSRSTSDPTMFEMSPYVGVSTDRGATYTVEELYPNATYFAPGSLFNCGTQATPQSRTLLTGNFDALDFPAIATSPQNPNDVYLTFSANPPGSDQAAVYFSRSTNGGQSFSTPTIVANNGRDQFFPDVAVAPNGTIGLGWYDRRNSSNNLNIDVYTQFSTDRASHWGPLSRVTSQSFGVPQMFPQFDTVFLNCSWPGGVDIIPAGAGFSIGWTDNRDRGPSANRSVDPNIYFARALVPTVITATVARTSSRINVTGSIAPAVTVQVTVTLQRRNSAGSFVKVSAVNRTISSSGGFTAAFTRPAAGTCRVIARFAGNPDYAPSSKTVNTPC